MPNLSTVSFRLLFVFLFGIYYNIKLNACNYIVIIPATRISVSDYFSQYRERGQLLLSASQQMSAGTAVALNGYVILFYKTCCVFGIGINGVSTHNTITSPHSPPPTSQRTSLGARTVPVPPYLISTHFKNVCLKIKKLWAYYLLMIQEPYTIRQTLTS